MLRWPDIRISYGYGVGRISFATSESVILGLKMTGSVSKAKQNGTGGWQ